MGKLIKKAGWISPRLLAPIALVVLYTFTFILSRYVFSVTGPVKIEATLSQTGELHVREERTFYKSQNGVYWNLSYPSLSLEVKGAGLVEANGNELAFNKASSQKEQTYAVHHSNSDESTEVRLYNHSSLGKPVTYFIEYDVNYIADKYRDVSELYWKFVGTDWRACSNNVTCTVHLPVPANQSIKPEDNTWAYGHGPLDGSISFNNDEVVYEIPAVSPGQFAEARILFPATWLSGDSVAFSTNHLKQTLYEEATWADEANQARIKAMLLAFVAVGAAIAVDFVALFIAYRLYRKRRNLCASLFNKKYYSSIPSTKHPGVLDYLYYGKVSPFGFNATFMRFVNKQVLSFAEPIENEFLIVHMKKVKELKGLDKLFYDCFIKDFVTEQCLESVTSKVTKNDVFLDMSIYEELSREQQQTLQNNFAKWKAHVEEATEKDDLVAQTLNAKKRSPYKALRQETIMSIALLSILGVLILAFYWFVGFSGLYWLMLLPIIGVDLGLIYQWAISPNIPLTQSGLTIYLKMEALARWLHKFEKMPQQVSKEARYWNQILIYASIMGVYPKTMKTLMKRLPQVIQNTSIPLFLPYRVGEDMVKGFASQFGGAGAFSELGTSIAGAAASSSSSTGGGGGFSGGGGGGAGGGGGGSF